MARHIIHLAMEAGGEPGCEALFGVTEIGARDAHGIEAECFAPILDLRRERSPVAIMHADHHTLTFELPDEAATLVLGAALAAQVGAGPAASGLITLEGDLGAGKTTLVRGWLRALGDQGPVKSPTYTLVELHAVSGLNLYHFDFYRFNQPEEYLDAGLDEYFAGDGICLVEWPDKAAPYLPAPDLTVCLTVAENGRHACVSAHSERGRPWLTGLMDSPSVAAMSSSSRPPA